MSGVLKDWTSVASVVDVKELVIADPALAIHVVKARRRVRGLRGARHGFPGERGGDRRVRGTARGSSHGCHRRP